MAAYVDFVTDLIYGTGLSPNHGDWVAANPSPGGTAWLDHHVDRMLPAMEGWIASLQLPPVTSWNGVVRAPWDSPATDLPVPASLGPGFPGITTLDQLGVALRDRMTSVAGVASELAGAVRAPFSYRYWSYVRWARDVRDRFLGLSVAPAGTLIDRDGTVLSAAPFCDGFNDLHRNWHVEPASSTQATPGFRSSAGQRTGRLGATIGLTTAQDFMRFHREHQELFRRWLARTGQLLPMPLDMGHPGGWPIVPPSTTSPTPWAFNEAGLPTVWPPPAATGTPDLRYLASLDDIGAIEFGYHGTGHGQNSDIGPLPHNNYVPRFHDWHGWIDAQWWWREPRFGYSDATTGARTGVFRPVLQDGSEFPGHTAISIVRDPALPADTTYPANALGALDLATGNGSLRLKLHVHDPFGRALRMRLVVEVLDGGGALVPAATATVLRTIGPAGDHPLDTEFFEDIALTGAFASDDPTRAGPAVGFVNGRIRVTGHLWVPNPATPDDPTTSPDAGFVHEDSVQLDLVREKLAPDALFSQSLSTFSEDQVNATMVAGTARFDDAFYLLVQDRTTAPVPAPAWPTRTADEVKGLLLGTAACSGLFDDVGHAPDVVLWQETVDAAFTGVTVELAGAPTKESPSLAPDSPQRLTYRYAIVFDAVNDAFAGMVAGDIRRARLRATVRDRAGNARTVATVVDLIKAPNPYMVDGPVPWLSIDTRVFSIQEGDSRLGETITGGAPLPYLGAIVGRLNAGTTGAETFESMPTDGALEYAASLTDVATGVTRRVYNFALAKVRLLSTVGASNVRMLFRLFRYSATNLLFQTSQGYRAFDDGAGRIVALPGFESAAAGAALTSIPFFASPRVDGTAATLDGQTDPGNVHSFAGSTSEVVWYFGAWLDINDATARLPASVPSGPPDGPFPVASVQSLRTLMRDFHQCMVAEIRFDGAPTESGASPFTSDKLAQRNLTILHSDNPGDPTTRVCEHAFQLDLARPPVDRPRPARERIAAFLADNPMAMHGDGALVLHHADDLATPGPACDCCGCTERDPDGSCLCCGDIDTNGPVDHPDRAGAVSTFAFSRMVDNEAMSLAMQAPFDPHILHDCKELARHLRPLAAQSVRANFPFVFHPTRWSQTALLIDELMIRWNNLPAGSRAELMFSGVAPAQVASLRNLRHAPPTVHPMGDGTLRLDVGGVTYVPLPPTADGKIAGLLRITLPPGVRAGQRFHVDALHLRAGSPQQNGAFRVELRVAKAAEFVDSVQRGVALLHEQLSLTPAADRWRPVLERRLRTERRRAADLSARAGVSWTDPTVWTDPHGHAHPVEGAKIRVVLEQIDVHRIDAHWWRRGAEIDFIVRVRSEDNGGVERRTRLPRHGHYCVGSGDSLRLDEVVFEGFVARHLAIAIGAMEHHLLEPDETLGRYVRVFQCDVEGSLGRYRPGDEAIDPEHVGAWSVHYRIERA